MDQQSRENLESRGWQIGTVTDFLDLTAEDLLIIEIKLALTRNLEERQQSVARAADAADTSKQEDPAESNPLSSLDQLMRDIITAGATPKEISQLIASIDVAAAA